MKNVIVGVNDLATTHPELAKEADGWDPTKIIAGSAKRLNWKCEKGHLWIAIVNNRSHHGRGCPICKNKKVLTGDNDLATTHPELAKEADGWDPTKIIGGTHKKLAWICSHGHKWNALGSARIRGSGCPVCHNQTVLTGDNDLATTHPELAKEADGWDPTKIVAGSGKKLNWKCNKGHSWRATAVRRKNGNGCPYCAKKTTKILYGHNDLATTHPELAKEADGWDPTKIVAGSGKKLNWKCNKGHSWSATVSHRKDGTGCPICKNKKVLAGHNDLATTHPELAKEADGWDPTEIIAGTDKKLNWKCEKGHSWKASVTNRSHLGRGCPVCQNQAVLTGHNDLATTHPELAKEADGWDPTKVMAGTGKRLKWKCDEGHHWFTPSNMRLAGTNCPTCSNRGFDPNAEGYLYFLIQPKWEMYQIGITNAPIKRLSDHNKNGFELLELRGPLDGHSVRELETSILRYLKNQKADLSPEHVAGKFDGYTESWTMDSYKVNNLKELIDKASEAGF
jgi:Zn finger protein HypA/HybF involved in hydrogenase expression